MPPSSKAPRARVRPLLMTVATTVLGLLPLLWEAGVGADVSARTAAPVVGGLWSCMFLTLLVLPAAYAMWRRRQVRGRTRARRAARCSLTVATTRARPAAAALGIRRCAQTRRRAPLRRWSAACGRCMSDLLAAA